MIQRPVRPSRAEAITVRTQAGDARVQKFKVSVAELLGRPGEYRDISVQEPLEGVSSTLAQLDERPLRADLRAESVVEGILITGRVEAATTERCARCLKEFSSELSVELCELFVAPGHEASAGEDPYRVRGTEIYLEPMLRDAVTLGLPLRPLCREDCKGLCARCGVDLNHGACGCVDEETDPRWADLDAVRDMLRERSS
jgi:uncharacterized protein